MEITAFEQQSIDSPYINVTHKLFITHRDSLYGLINKDFIEIIPIKYAEKREYLDGDYPFIHYNYFAPNISYTKETNQYIYIGKNIFADQMEAFIISAGGDAVVNIPNCTSIIWEPAKSMYSITLSGSDNKFCDTQGNIK